jgi:hypothetical protein
MMTSPNSSHQRKSFLIERPHRGQVNRVSILTDGSEEERTIHVTYWRLISPYWDRVCLESTWEHKPSPFGAGTKHEFDTSEPYVMLAGLFEAISGSVGLTSRIVNQKQRDGLILLLIERWFSEKLFRSNDLARGHDQMGQRWIDALPRLSTFRHRPNPAFVSPALVPWLADRVQSHTFINRGEDSGTTYFRWMSHEGKNGAAVFAAHFTSDDRLAYAIGPVISSDPLDFGIMKRPTADEELQALEFLMKISGADADAAKFDHPNRELSMPAALRAILFAARSSSSPAPFELPSSGSLFAA